MSLARRHRETTLAALASAGTVAVEGIAPAMPETGPGASDYQLLLAALGIDLNQLRNIESVERKIEAKRAMIERYRPWVEGALSAETAVQDEIVANMAIWSIDVGDWPYALRLAAHMLAHGVALPERFDRKPATLFAEEFAEAGLKKPPLIGLADLTAVLALIDGHDLHDQVGAKLHKALGLAYQAQADAFDATADNAIAGGKGALLDAALTHARRALELNSACGVKKQIEALERQRAKLAAPEGTQA